MAEQRWSTHALSIGVFEFRRSVRDMWRDKTRLIFLIPGVLFPTLIGTILAVVFADQIRGIEALPVLNMLRGMIALFWLFDVFLVAQRVTSARPRIEADSLMLTTVSARTVAGGLCIAETLRILAYIGLPTLVVTGTFVFLFGSVISIIMVPAAVVLFTTTIVVTGSLIGYAVAWLVATSRFVARHKTVLGGTASLIVMGGYSAFIYPEISGVGYETVAWFPMGGIADLGVVGTRIVGSPLRSVGVLLTSVLVLFGGGAVIERETVSLWFTDPVSIETSDTGPESISSERAETPPSRRDPISTAVWPLIVPTVVSTPVRRVAQWVLLRTRRDPNRLMFIMIPLFAIGSSLISAGIQSGSIGAMAAPSCAVVGPWLAGSVFAMNPFGDEGAVLPVTLTAISGKQYVRGLMVPGLLFGLPIVIAVTGVAGVLSPYTPAVVAGLVGTGAYVTCMAVTVAPAIGMVLPRFSAISVGQSRDVRPPRMSAVAIQTIVTVLPSVSLITLLLEPTLARTVLAGVVGFVPAVGIALLDRSNSGVLAGASEWFYGIGQQVLAFSTDQVQIVGGGLVILIGFLFAIVLYRYAVHRFERYSPQ